MSRIHEALKKAEADRASGLRREAALPMTVDPTETASARRPPIEGALAVEGAVATAVAASETLTFETLRERCLRPRWNPDGKTMLFLEKDEYASGTEEFRTLRSRLYKIREKQPLRTLLITSSLPAEGKTFVTANLAQVISRQHERKALLIDGDLRRSQLHVPLGAPHEPGLTEYLRGDLDVHEVVQQSPQANLFFIPGGKTVTNPAELLGNGRLQQLFEAMGGIFDWIIVDSPPVLPVADASMLARMVDGVLFVVSAGSTPFDLAQKACQEFRDKHLLGVVLNRQDAPGRRDSYYGYGYRGYGVKAATD
jgi:capsular exopolysaccharide synthesis family protein